MHKEVIEVFLSYSHQDRALVDRLRIHLSALRRLGVIQYWSDQEIEAGTEWSKAIVSHLDSADIIILLLSPDFLASEYSREEAEIALKRHQSGEARVIPVLLRPVDLSATPFTDLQMTPSDGVSVTQWADQDEAFVNVSREIRRAAKALTARAMVNEA
jgi:TIR domain